MQNSQILIISAVKIRKTMSANFLKVLQTLYRDFVPGPHGGTSVPRHL